MVRCYKKHHDRRWRWRERRLTNGPAQRKHFGDLPITGGADCQAVSKTPRDGDEFSVGQGITVTALHTSCHTQDSICYVFCDGDDRAVFTGDTLFIGGTVPWDCLALSLSETYPSASCSLSID